MAGCQVIEGVVRRGNPIRVLRDNVVVYEGELESLRRYKDDDVDAVEAQAIKDHPFQRVIVLQFVSAEYVQSQEEEDD